MIASVGTFGMTIGRQVLYTLSIAFFFTISATMGNADSFDEGVAKTYAPYRSATSYLRTGNTGLASLDLAEAHDAWKSVQSIATQSPPAAYTNDPKFLSDIGKIRARLALGLALAESDDGKSALKELKPIRSIIYELRKRNGVRLYADCITELNMSMAGMSKYRHNLPALTDPKERSTVANAATEYGAIAVDCIGLAPPGHHQNLEFQRLAKNTKASATALSEAAKMGDPVRYLNILREIRSLDRIIYFRFGG